ncbi:hypothetical protein F7Q99_20460 [Streptomyces kaniharaensis]|uniref:Uncharacterized protein n=1 Tax=Streptomyces kaniharaensis TaxID=212423 RepID=A0A6N7KYB4_9ACTN|nr:hypothetical protein [Streptomyces kaniharaensis]MQS14573.1 hypothetical protein [Streptomyces kaniharaensis]
MDGIPPERMVTDSWPALHGRPVLRRTVAVGLVLCVSVAAALLVRGINTFTLGRGVRETDRDRAERLAGLHPSQHPGADRYYVPVGAVYAHTADGAAVAYLHYRVAGGKDVGLGDFLRAYDLPAPGPAAPLPPDLATALGGDEPDEAPELPEPSPSPTATASPAASPAVSPTASPTADFAADSLPAADQAPGEDTTDAPEPSPTPSATPTATPITPTATPITPTAAPTTATPTTRRIYVSTIPGGLPGAADIYVRATG